jgi:predicted kinase
MVNLIVMCGLQCSGKSTKARELADQYNAQIISSDYIREQHPDWDNEKVFKNVYQMINFFLENEKSVVLDATNVTLKARKQIFQNVKQPCTKICHIMNVSFEECCERLKKRNESDYPHKFDADVIKKYYYSFEIPFYEEGWDEIKVENIPTITDASNYMNLIQEKAEKFDQQNMHHTQNLGQHMDTVGELLEETGINDIIVRAGYFHDVGKLFTQIFKEGDENAHYYSHANVGAYKLLCRAGIYDNSSIKECVDNDYKYTIIVLSIFR